jgi:hypothetical protein
MLITMRAYKEALRGLLYYNAFQVDLERHAESDEERQRAAELVALFTPISKAWSTDVGVEMASIGIQVHGGMGFVEETGAAQFYRDIRIAPIYEGTNGIQAIDLVTRKLGMGQGQVVLGLLDEIEKAASDAGPDLDDVVAPLLEAVTDVRQATRHLLALTDPNDALAAATPYLRMLGLLLGGWVHTKSAIAAVLEPNDEFMRGRLGLARFYNTQVLPMAQALLPAVTAPQAQLAESFL